MSVAATIFGLSGAVLSPAETAFFRDANPWAFILFSRNIETPDQVRRLTGALREAVGRDCLIFVDQEGGRVQRFRPPHWRAYPPAGILGQIYAETPREGLKATYQNYRLIADDLRKVGVNADCAPVLDLRQPDADPIISDRAFSTQTAAVIRLANAAIAGLMAGGVAPVIKHIPGHGRARVDSHKALPRIDTDLDTLEFTDFRPFKSLAHAPMAMTAHAVYSAVADTAITISEPAMTEIIRKRIGYTGLVMTDDLDMHALTGSLSSRTEKALAAGCDVVLQCSGRLPDMVEVMKAAKPLSGQARYRAGIAEYCAQQYSEFDRREAIAELSEFIPDFTASV